MPPTAAPPAAVAETHSGVVFFLGDRAYKLKKPVDLGFLDFRTRESRLDACRREVELNRRLAPDVYLGIADVSGPDGAVCDHLVVMRRLPEDRRLSALVTAGAAVDQDLDRLARLLACFHAVADRSPAIDEAAGRDAVARRWEANAAEMDPFAGRVLDPWLTEEVMRLARRFLAGREPLFACRIAEGRARDGHGDLLGDDIFCLADGPRVLDCLEFDDRLRYGDVLADVAFLAMDLERLGRRDLATLFLERYRAASRDCWPQALADHYVAYRALVRAKVACLRWEQGDRASAASATRLLGLCHQHLREGQVRLVLVGGAPRTGKSTLAGALAARLGAVLIRSDEVRKELAGLDPLTPAPAAVDTGLYEPWTTATTYAELLRRAATQLGLGRTVVLDATWRDPVWRAGARSVAADASADLVEFRCVTPLEVALQRATSGHAGADPSDATADVVRALWSQHTPWPTAVALDTSRDPEGALADALATIHGTRPAAARNAERSMTGGR